MDWVKVAHQLDDEWFRRKRLSEHGRSDDPFSQRHQLLSDLASMLRDCLIVGLSKEDRDRYDEKA